MPLCGPLFASIATHTNMETSTSTYINLQQVFPSLFTTLKHLKSEPYEAGWLLGCVNDVAVCFIRAYVRAHPAGNVDDHLSTARIFAHRYLQDFGMPSSSNTASHDVPLVDVDELVNVVRMVHTSHTLANWRWPPSFATVNDQPAHEDLCVALEDRFSDLVFDAVVESLYDGAAEGVDVMVLNWGWSDGKLPPTILLMPRTD